MTFLKRVFQALLSLFRPTPPPLPTRNLTWRQAASGEQSLVGDIDVQNGLLRVFNGTRFVKVGPISAFEFDGDNLRCTDPALYQPQKGS